MKKILIMISGRGSNMKAIAENIEKGIPDSSLSKKGKRKS